MTSFTLLQGRDMEIEYKKKIKHAVEPTAIQHSISNLHMKSQRRGVQISYFELLGKDKKKKWRIMVHVLFFVMLTGHPASSTREDRCLERIKTKHKHKT